MHEAKHQHTGGCHCGCMRTELSEIELQTYAAINANTLANPSQGSPVI
ncbi:MAG: hypothetical protein PVI97_18415 [Candidatus Thiodiazotropha sp.]|jgi:hypothetical protein